MFNQCALFQLNSLKRYILVVYFNRVLHPCCVVSEFMDDLYKGRICCTFICVMLRLPMGIHPTSRTHELCHALLVVLCICCMKVADSSLHLYPDLLGNFIISNGTCFQNGIFEALRARPPFSSSGMDYSFSIYEDDVGRGLVHTPHHKICSVKKSNWAICDRRVLFGGGVPLLSLLFASTNLLMWVFDVFVETQLL